MMLFFKLFAFSKDRVSTRKLPISSGAFITVSISYILSASVVGQSSVTMVVTAPNGFKFSSGSSCLQTSVSAGPSVFKSCVGNNNVATLTSSGTSLAAGQVTIQVFEDV